MTQREIPNSARLEEIRATDAAAGESLQMCPRAWQDRRDLLTYIDALESQLRARGTTKENLVQVSVVAALQDLCPHGYRLEDLLTGASVCDAGCEVHQ